jgi:pimeloyl-ACP methyl ester carboxylesterase
LLLRRGISVFAYDSVGCGLSGGKYVSLGYHEERDLGVVLRHLRRSGAVSSIALWGRSMGASTAILRSAKDQSLSACVLDSPFADLQVICQEFVGRALPLPTFLMDAAIDAVREEVKARADFDMYDVKPCLAAPKAKCPALFAVALSDKLVAPHHAEELRHAWGGDCGLVSFEGGHNDLRPDSFLIQAVTFLAHKLASEVRAPVGQALISAGSIPDLGDWLHAKRNIKRTTADEPQQLEKSFGSHLRASAYLVNLSALKC